MGEAGGGPSPGRDVSFLLFSLLAVFSLSLPFLFLSAGVLGERRLRCYTPKHHLSSGLPDLGRGLGQEEPLALGARLPPRQHRKPAPIARFISKPHQFNSTKVVGRAPRNAAALIGHACHMAKYLRKAKAGRERAKDTRGCWRSEYVPQRPQPRV